MSLDTFLSKLLAAVAERDKPRFRHMSRKEWDEIFYPCRSRKPVDTWPLANHVKVIKARQHRNGWNGLQWGEIARIMALDGILGSRGEPPNANSVRRVWDRVVREARRAERGNQAEGQATLDGRASSEGIASPMETRTSSRGG